MVKDDLFLETF